MLIYWSCCSRPKSPILLLEVWTKYNKDQTNLCQTDRKGNLMSPETWAQQVYHLKFALLKPFRKTSRSHAYCLADLICARLPQSQKYTFLHNLQGCMQSRTWNSFQTLFESFLVDVVNILVFDAFPLIIYKLSSDCDSWRCVFVSNQLPLKKKKSEIDDSYEWYMDENALLANVQAGSIEFRHLHSTPP